MKGFKQSFKFTEKEAAKLEPHDEIDGIGIVQPVYVHRYSTTQEYQYAERVYKTMFAAQKRPDLIDSMICIPEKKDLIIPYFGKCVDDLLIEAVHAGQYDFLQVPPVLYKRFAATILGMPYYMRPFDLHYKNVCIDNGDPLIIDIEAQWSVGAQMRGVEDRYKNEVVDNVEESILGLAVSMGMPYQALTKAMKEIVDERTYNEYRYRRNVLYGAIHCLLVNELSTKFIQDGVDCISLHAMGDQAALVVFFKDGHYVAYKLSNRIYDIGYCESPQRRALWLEHGMGNVASNLHHYIYMDPFEKSSFSPNDWKAYHVVA